MEYSDDFQKVLNDPSGLFQIRDDDVVHEEFQRLHRPQNALSGHGKLSPADINQDHRIERDEIRYVRI